MIERERGSDRGREREIEIKRKGWKGGRGIKKENRERGERKTENKKRGPCQFEDPSRMANMHRRKCPLSRKIREFLSILLLHQGEGRGGLITSISLLFFVR